MTEKILLTSELQKLIQTYFKAFSNLYGIIPMYQALHIIQQQNPEIMLDEEHFIAYLDSLDEDVRGYPGENIFNKEHYIICGAEEIDEDVLEKTPPLQRDLITEYLYAIDGFDSYHEMKDKQADKPYYIPEKKIMMQYAKDHFYEKSDAYYAIGDFLRNKMKVMRAYDITDELQMDAHMGCSLRTACFSINRIERRNCFQDRALLADFASYYLELCKNTRTHSNRGFTCTELGIDVDDTRQYDKLDQTAFRKLRNTMDNEIAAMRMLAGNLPALPKLSKIGRNEPCPCGSGKKYKKCCGL